MNSTERNAMLRLEDKLRKARLAVENLTAEDVNEKEHILIGVAITNALYQFKSDVRLK